MSELGGFFSAMHEESKARRAHNREASLELLNSRGFKADALSDSHFRIGDFDFWPSTGRYFNRKTRIYGRGVFNLLKKLEAGK